MSRENIHQSYENSNDFEREENGKPEIDIVEEELHRFEFESAGKTTILGSQIVPAIQLHRLPMDWAKKSNNNP